MVFLFDLKIIILILCNRMNTTQLSNKNGSKLEKFTLDNYIMSYQNMKPQVVEFLQAAKSEYSIQYNCSLFQQQCISAKKKISIKN
jgi:hypothetical protein